MLARDPDHFPAAELGEYVVMPNHVHGIIVLHERADEPSTRRGTIYRAPTLAMEHYPRPAMGSIPTIVRTYKAAVTRAILRQCGGGVRLWQRNYWEHVIRDEKDWERIHLYIAANIARWAEDEENPVR